MWKLETAYWNYVKAADLDGYRKLWHRDFVDWPSSSSQPARKDHITDWITAYTDKGIRLQWYSIQPAASQAAGEHRHRALLGDVVLWADEPGHGRAAANKSASRTHRSKTGEQVADPGRHVENASCRVDRPRQP